MPLCTPAAVVEMASAYYASATLFAAIEGGVFAALATAPATAAAVAQRQGLDVRGTRLLLDACTALGLLIKDGDLYANSPAATLCLVPGSPSDLKKR